MERWPKAGVVLFVVKKWTVDKGKMENLANRKYNVMSCPLSVADFIFCLGFIPPKLQNIPLRYSALSAEEKAKSRIIL